MYFATTNQWKFTRAKDYFAMHNIVIDLCHIEIPELRSEDVCEVAKEKARFAFEKLQKPVFILDAGLYIKALHGFPTTYVKFAEKYIGSEGIIKLMKGEKDRSWEFPHAVYYIDAQKEKSFVGTLKGSISNKPALVKKNKFGRFNDIMIPQEHNKSFAEMSDQEIKNYEANVWSPTVYSEFIRWIKNRNPKDK